MTDFPPPSDRPESTRSAAFALFWPVLIAIATVSVALAALVLTHSPRLETATASPPAEIVLAEAEPPPEATTGDFQAKASEPGDSEPPASDRYELALRLERGDTVEKLLADIGVAEAEARQIAEKLQSLLKKNKLATGETLALTVQTLPDQPDAPRVLSLIVRPQPEREYIVTRNEDGSYSAEEKTYKVGPRIVRVESDIAGSLQQSGVKAGAPVAAMNEFIKALSYDVDFQRELKAGLRFTVVLEQLVTSDGRVTHQGRLLAGELKLAKRHVTVVRFKPQGGADQFFNPDGPLSGFGGWGFAAPISTLTKAPNPISTTRVSWATNWRAMLSK